MSIDQCRAEITEVAYRQYPCEGDLRARLYGLIEERTSSGIRSLLVHDYGAFHDRRLKVYTVSDIETPMSGLVLLVHHMADISQAPTGEDPPSQCTLLQIS